MNKEIAVKQNDENPVTVEVLAESIKSISDGVKKLRAGRLNDKAIVLLIQNAAPSVGNRYQTTKVSVNVVRAVLEGMESLEETYLKKKAPRK